MPRPVIEYNGRRYYQREDGYYGNNKGGLLHRAIYTDNYGPIPPGKNVHHIDHDKENNDPANLTLLTPKEHWHEHGDDRPADWHSLGGRKMWATRPVVTVECTICGTPFDQRKIQPALYCSKPCARIGQHNQSRAEATCEVCGTVFVTIKYTPARTCSPHCRAIFAYRTRRASVRPDGGD
jgi:predicted nucleic acid-binding Zn ribbon protein